MPMCRLNCVSFWNGDVRLAGRIFRNPDRLEERQPAIIVTGSWLTVKEQMPAVYAQPLPRTSSARCRGSISIASRTTRFVPALNTASPPTWVVPPVARFPTARAASFGPRCFGMMGRQAGSSVMADRSSGDRLSRLQC
jgi:hypothetical protein